jgi:hypothetical protein
MLKPFALSMGLCIATTTVSLGDEMSLNEQWLMLNKQTPPAATAWAGSLPSKGSVSNMLADRAREKLGSGWVRSAMALGKIESNYRCDAVGPRTRHGHAMGILQVLPSSAVALGIDPSTLRSCEGGIEAGLRHMAACIESGVRTHEEMAACHVAGVNGWRTRLNRSAERYKRQYIRMASVAWAGALRESFR